VNGKKCHVSEFDSRKWATESEHLERILFPNSIERIRKDCLDRFPSLREIVFESDPGLKIMSFGRSRLKSIHIPNNVEMIGAECFCECYRLEEIVFQSNSMVNVICYGAFKDSMDIKSVLVPNNVEILHEMLCEMLGSS
jgi:hypothetical protein